MNKEQIDIELIESYIAGNISDIKIKELKERLITDQEFNQLYTDILFIAKQTKVNILNDKVKLLKELDQSLKPIVIKKTNHNKKGIIFLTIFIFTCLFFGSKYLINTKNKVNPTAELLFKEEFVHKKFYYTFKSDNSNLTALKNATVQNYELKKYNLSASGFEKLFETDNDTTFLYYAAISNLANNNLIKAQSQFEICRNASIIDQKELEKYSMLTNLRAGNINDFNNNKKQ